MVRDHARAMLAQTDTQVGPAYHEGDEGHERISCAIDEARWKHDGNHGVGRGVDV